MEWGKSEHPSSRKTSPVNHLSFIKEKVLGKGLSSALGLLWDWGSAVDLFPDILWNNTNVNSENVFCTKLSVCSKTSLSSLVLPFQKRNGLVTPSLPFECEEPKFSHGQTCFEPANPQGWWQTRPRAAPAVVADNFTRSVILRTPENTQLNWQTHLLCDSGSVMLILAAAWHFI